VGFGIFILLRDLHIRVFGDNECKGNGKKEGWDGCVRFLGWGGKKNDLSYTLLCETS